MTQSGHSNRTDFPAKKVPKNGEVACASILLIDLRSRATEIVSAAFGVGHWIWVEEYDGLSRRDVTMFDLEQFIAVSPIVSFQC